MSLKDDISSHINSDDLDSILSPKENDFALLKNWTGIQDDEELKQHVARVQAEAYAIFPYSCIRSFRFIGFKINRYPSYEDVLELGKQRPGAIFLEIACCFGNDTRKAIADGYPIENVVVSDLCPEFWNLGHQLYKTTPETYPVPFVGGDLFDPVFLSSDAPSFNTSAADPPQLQVPLNKLTSLTPLQKHVSVIHAASLFHLFDLDRQCQLAHLLSTLLSPLPGSVILGSDSGVADNEENTAGGLRFFGRNGEKRFAHSPTSWKKLWVGKGGVFQDGEVEVRSVVSVREAKRDIPEVHQKVWHAWSITRL